MDKIDLVYTWVDDSDPVWQKKKSDFLKQNNIDSESNNKCRFKNNDELKYSLRSVEKYAPWINHIYIVTDNQYPSWLNTDNPKISIVDHKEIIPSDILPTFNSRVIEHCIANIPNLSEKFLYANDDTFIYCDVKPNFFYTKDDKPIYRVLRKINSDDKGTFISALKNSGNLILEDYGKKYFRLPHHNIDPFKKSTIVSCYSKYENQIKETMNRKFRASEDISRFVYHYYACANNEGKYKVIHKIDSDLPWYKHIVNWLLKRYKKDSVYMWLSDISRVKNVLEKYNPTLVCINDNELATDEDREILKQLMNELFPNKSSFEK